MKTKDTIIWLSILFLLIGTEAWGITTKTTADDQTNLEVTVYNNNLGLIKDTRRVPIPQGEVELRFTDVASQIMPVTVHVKSLDAPDSFSVLEQNYEYDLINEKRLLDKYVGKQIKLIDENKFQDRKETVEATLLSNNQGQVYRINGEIYLGYPGIKVLPEIPENLIAKPTLTWLCENRATQSHRLEVSYLTGGITWEADYIMTLGRDDTSSDLSGWVTIDNKSGATYRNTSLKLIAGEVHRAEQKTLDGAYQMERMTKSAIPQFKEEGFFEYHIYDLQRRTTIKDKQTKQISLLEATDVKLRKEFLVHGTIDRRPQSTTEEAKKLPVNVYIIFMNSSENGLGMPLPEGTVRMYKSDSHGGQQFIGEDRIQHIPKDEQVRLTAGVAFDITAEKRQMDFRQITSRLNESEWEIVLKNHRKEDMPVGVLEPMSSNWEMVSSSHPFTKINASTVRFDVQVPKDNEITIRYRVQSGL
ncbi:MAG TPA: hypothetical protein PKZ42_12650 [Syntrophales bacterium]|nr:hypothetical protein [Syntrophales bacterium]